MTGRIEKVRTQPMLSEILRHPFGKARDRQPRGVGTHQRPWFTKFVDALKQIPFDLEVFDHGFDDPIRFGNFG